MNAHQARELALIANIENVDSQYNKIALSITKEVSKGKYEMWWYENIPSDVRAKLVSEGYTIGPTNYNQRDGGILTKISW